MANSTILPNASLDHEVETVFANSFWKAETSWGTENGTAGQGFAPFKGFNITPNFIQNKNTIDVQGFTLPLGVMAGVENSEWSGDGWLCYEEMAFFASFISQGKANPNSFTLQHKKLKSTGCVVKGYSITSTPEQMTASLSFVGKTPVTQQNEFDMPTTAPTLHFFEPMKNTVTLTDKSASGSSQLVSKLNAFKFEMADMWAIVNYIDPDYGTDDSKQSIAQTRASGTFSMTLPMDDNCYGFLHSNSLYHAKIENKTTYGSTIYNFTIDFDFMWNAPSTPSDTDNVWTIELNGAVMNSAQGTSGADGAVKITAGTSAVSNGSGNGE